MFVPANISACLSQMRDVFGAALFFFFRLFAQDRYLRIWDVRSGAVCGSVTVSDSAKASRVVWLDGHAALLARAAATANVHAHAHADSAAAAAAPLYCHTLAGAGRGGVGGGGGNVVYPYSAWHTRLPAGGTGAAPPPFAMDGGSFADDSFLLATLSFTRLSAR